MGDDKDLKAAVQILQGECKDVKLTETKDGTIVEGTGCSTEGMELIKQLNKGKSVV